MPETINAAFNNVNTALFVEARRQVHTLCMKRIDRVQERLRELGMKEAEFAGRLGETQQTVNNWKRRDLPKARSVEVADVLGLRPEWLERGELPRERQAAPSNVEAATAAPVALAASLMHIRIAKGYDEAHAGKLVGVTAERWKGWERGEDLPPPPRLALIAGAFGVSLGDLTGAPAAEESNIERVERNPFSHVRRIPLVSLVQAGAWTEAREQLPDDVEWLDAEDVSQEAFAVRVKGDSMEPLFPPGTMLIVDPARRTCDPVGMVGQYVIARLPNTNEATFKQLVEDAGKLFLKPANPAYRLIDVAEDCEIVGVVVESRQRWSAP